MKKQQTAETVSCQRCGKPCRAGVSSKPSARPFQKAMRGFCSSCVIAALLQDMNPDGGLGYALASSPDFTPEGLRLPHIQELFKRVLEIGGSELPYGDIDWDEVIANWDLPFPGKIETYKNARVM
jgi:hypothetical protein